jgi:TetR/AcrR family transcriptional regulator
VVSADQTAATRERILEVAVREFARKGLAGARVDEIARLAGANKQLLYYYFGSKQGLFEAALAQLMGEYDAFYAAGPEDETFHDRLVRYAQDQTDERLGLWRRLVLWEALQPAPEAADGASSGPADEQAWEAAVGELRAAREEGELDPRLDPEIMTLAMVGIIHLPHLLPRATRAITGASPSDDEFVERHAAFVDTLLRLIAPQGGSQKPAGSGP